MTGFLETFRQIRRKRLVSTVRETSLEQSDYTTQTLISQGFSAFWEGGFYVYKAPYSIWVNDQKVANFAFISHACLCWMTAFKDGVMVDGDGTTISVATIRDVYHNSYPGIAKEAGWHGIG